MENLHEVAALLRKQLAEIEAKIIDITPPTLVPMAQPKVEKEHVMSVDEMRDMLSNMYECKKWKKFVQKTDVVENIDGILDDCYYSYIDAITESKKDVKPTDIFGKKGSAKWQNFKLEAMKKLISPTQMEQDFSDTANGCDEIAWDAGSEVLEAMLN